MKNESKANLIKTIVLAGFTASIAYHFILSNYFDLNFYPYSTFLFKPNDRFNDFYNIYYASGSLNPYSSPLSVYFPLTFIIMYIFTLFQANYAFGLYLALFVSFTAYYVYRGFPAQNITGRLLSVFILTALSYPFLFVVDRGNLEGILFIFLALFIYFYRKGDDLLASLFLACAILMKIYPGVFVILFLADKRYRNIFYTGAATVVLGLLSAAVLRGGVVQSFVGFKNNMDAFNEAYIGTAYGLQHNTSIFGALKVLQFEFFPGISVLIDNFFVIALVFFGLMTAYIVFSEKTLWKRVALLSFSILLLPQISFDYRMVHLFIPLMLFINSGEQARLDALYTVMFGLLFIPKDYYIIVNDISIAVLINPLIMLVITATMVFEKVLYKAVKTKAGGGGQIQAHDQPQSSV